MSEQISECDVMLEEDQWGRGQGSLHHSITRGQSDNSSVDGSRVPQYCQAYFGDTACSLYPLECNTWK